MNSPQIDEAFRGGCAWAGGRFMPAREAAVPVLDWGFLHSDATYDVAGVYDGAFFRLDDHLDRFEHSMSRLRMDTGLSRTQIADILEECVVRAGLRRAYVEMIATRGTAAPGSRDPRTCANTFMAFAVPFIWVADPEKQKTGLDARIASVNRIAPSAVDPTVKNYHWLDMTMALFEAYDSGQETALLTDGAGNVVEGPGFNIFTVTGGRAATPAQGVLLGVTRRTVIELCAEAGIELQEREVPAAEVRAADEVFISTTGGGVIPVTRIDGAPVGGGLPGPVTRDLSARYWALRKSGRYSTPVNYNRALSG